MPEYVNAIAWAVSIQGEYIGPIHLQQEFGEGPTFCGLDVGDDWISRSPGMFFKRRKLPKREALCPVCLRESGGRGPIAEKQRSWLDD